MAVPIVCYISWHEFTRLEDVSRFFQSSGYLDVAVGIQFLLFVAFFFLL